MRATGCRNAGLSVRQEAVSDLLEQCQQREEYHCTAAATTQQQPTDPTL